MYKNVLMMMLMAALTLPSLASAESDSKVWEATFKSTLPTVEQVRDAIEKDVCRGVKQMMSGGPCRVPREWLDKKDLDGNPRTTEYFVELGADWSGSGGSENRIYQVRGQKLVKIFEGFGTHVLPLWGWNPKRIGLPLALVLVSRQGFCDRGFTFMVLSDKGIYEVQDGEAGKRNYIATFMTPACDPRYEDYSDAPPHGTEPP